MAAARADPGRRYNDATKKEYQQHVINIIFAKQVVHPGAFADEDPCLNTGWTVPGSTFMSVTGVLLLLLLVFMLISYSLRRTAQKLIDQAAERDRRYTSSPTAPIVTTSFTASTVSVDSTVDVDSRSESIAVPYSNDILPGYESLRPSFDPDAVAAARDNNDEREDPAADDVNEQHGDESDADGQDNNECPYPRMQFPGCPINVIEPPHIVDRPCD